MQKNLNVLHIEDSADDADLIRLALEEAGYQLEYRRIETAAEMQQALNDIRWDVVLSDYSLPKFDPGSALVILQQSGLDVPFILLSSFVGEETAVALMRAGAHDFIMKDKLARLAPAIEREVKEARERQKRRDAEEALRASEKLLHDITSALGEGIFVLDCNGHLMFMNAEAENLLGWTENELFGSNMHEIMHCVNADGSLFPMEECPILHYGLARGERYQSEDDVFVRKDGTLFPVSYVTTPIKGDVVFAAVTVFKDISARKQAEREIIESRQQLQELSVFLQTVREHERTRFARELHDELGQALTALRIDLNWLNEKLPPLDEKINAKLAGMSTLLDKTVDSMRRIAEDLRPGMLDDLGLAAAVEHHVSKFAERSGIACELDMSHEDFELGNNESTALFRLLQESLTNVARHAQATKVNVLLEDLGAEMHLLVVDNGRGLTGQPIAERQKFGLLGMRERVKILGGRISISSQPGQGTRIEAYIAKQQAEGRK